MSLYGTTFDEEDKNKSSLYGQTFNPDFKNKVAPPVKVPPVPPVRQSSWLDQLKVGDFKGLMGGNAPAPISSPSSPQLINGNATISQHNPSLLERIGTSLSGIGKAFNSGGENSPVVTGLTRLALGKQYSATPTPTPYVPQNLAESLASGAGEQASEWPLWMAGGAVAKGLMGAAEVATPIVGSLPNAIKSGLELGATYGGAVAPAETVLQGDGLQGLINREKQVPAMALGGVALHGAGQLIGKGIGEVGNMLADRKLGQITQPLDEAVQNAYKSPTLQDMNTNELQKNSVKYNTGIDQTPNPITPLPQLELNAKQGDLQKLFNDLPNQGKYSFTTSEQRALSNLQDGIQTAQNYIGHTDVLAGYPPGTSIPTAYADIAKNTGADLPKLMSSWEKSQSLKTSMTPQELSMGRTAGVIPNLAPRKSWTDLVPQEVIEPPSAQVAPPISPSERLTWTNKDSIPTAPNNLLPKDAPIGAPKDVQPIVPDAVSNAPIGEGKIAPAVNDTAFWDKVKAETGYKGDTTSLQADIKAGKIDTSNLSMKMDLQKFAETAKPSILGTKVETTTLPTLGEATPNQYVDTKPIDISIGKNDKATSTDIRQGYVGKMNSQIVAGNQLRDTMQKLAPKEQEGIHLFIDAGGNMEHLKEMANNPDPRLDSFIGDTKVTKREAYNQALNLSPDAQKAAQMAQTYYKESGQYALNTGSTKSVLENYASRLWKQPPAGTVKTEVNKLGLNPYTSHSKERVYGTIGEGILNGKEPATLNAGDLLSIHNQEMARANTPRVLASSLKDNGLGAYQFEKPSLGFTAIDSMGKDIPTMHDGKPAIIHQNFVIPDGIAKGLKSITEPNYTAKVDAIRHLQAYQGLVKTVDLSFSLFHHITLAAQAIYNSHGGIDFIKNWDNMSKLGSETFNKSEQWGAQHGLMTTKIEDNIDVLRQLSGKESMIGKVGNVPVVKQVAWLADKNTEFLFGKIQRWLKVTDFQNKASEYVGKNPSMDNTEVTKGLRQIASEVNDAYGGLNWKAIGVTPSVQAISRLGFLAPDWTFSSARMLGKAFTKGPGGNAARSQFAVGVVGGAILTEGVNKLLTGHYTNQNAKGHELEVEVQPGVYISMFRSGIGDVTKWSANMLNQGVLSGTVNTIQGKASPLIRTAVGQLANKQFTGAPITSTKNTPLQNDFARIKELGNSFAPVPFGVSGTGRYLKSGEATPLGTGLVSTGAGRYSQTKPISTLADPSSAYAGNWLNDLMSPSSAASDALITKINAQNKVQTDNTASINQKLGKALTTGGSTSDVFKGSNIPASERKQLLTAAKDKLAVSKLPPLAQKFQSLSKSNQQQFLKTITPEERKTLGNVKLKTK